MLLPESERLDARTSINDPIAAVLQNRMRHIAQHRLVLHDEYRFFATLHQSSRRRLGFPSGHRFRMSGQKDSKSGALAWLARNLEPSFMLLDNAINRRQPEASALADLLRGEKRFEDAAHRDSIHSTARV